MRALLLFLLLFFAVPAAAQTPAPAAAGDSATVSSPSGKLTIPTKDDWYSTCWVCSLLQLMDDVRQDYGKRAFELIAGQIATPLSIFLALWFLFQAAQLMNPFGGQEAPKVLNGLVKQLILTMIVIGLVQNYQLFWRIQDMIVSVGSKVSQAYINNAARYVGNKEITTCTPPASSPGSVSSDATQKFLCNVEIMQRVLGMGIKLGHDLWKGNETVSYMDATVGGGGQSLLRWTAGLGLIAAAAPLLILIIARVVDILINLTIITILSPVLTLSFIFPISRQITTLAVKVLFASGINIMLTGGVIAVFMVIIKNVLDMGNATNVAGLSLQNGILSPDYWRLLALYIATGAILKQTSGWSNQITQVPATMRMPMFAMQIFERLGKSIGNNFNSTRKQLQNLLPFAQDPAAIGTKLRSQISQRIPTVTEMLKNPNIPTPKFNIPWEKKAK
jgi:hypothetical protein